MRNKKSSAPQSVETLAIGPFGWRVNTFGDAAAAHGAIIALHGFTGSGADFAQLAADPAGQDWFWICPDLPGHGPGPVPGLHDAGTLPWLLAGIGRVLDRWPALPPPLLLGYSMGGRLALHAAVRLHRRLRGLVVIGAGGGLATPQERAARRADDARWLDLLAAGDMDAFAAAWEAQELLQTQARIPEPWGTALRQRRRASQADGLGLSLRSHGTGMLPQVWDQLPALNVPVLVVTGERDPRFAAIAKRLTSVLPDAAWELVPDAGHTAHLEQPQAFLRILGNWRHAQPHRQRSTRNTCAGHLPGSRRTKLRAPRQE